jgi:hypothetical protein
VFTTRDILYTAAVPAAVALAVLLASWRPWRRGERAAVRGHWGGALGAGLAFLAAFALLDGRVPPWPPAESRHWLFYFAAGLTVLALFDVLIHAWLARGARLRTDWLRAEIALVVFAAAVFLMFQSLLRSESWTAIQAGCHLLMMTVVLHAAWASSEMLVLRLPRPAGPLVLSAFAGAVAMVVMMSGSLVYGRLAGVLAITPLIASAVAPAAPGFSFARGGVTVIVPTAIAILFLGHHYVDPGVTATNAGWLLAGLVLPWAAALPPLRRRRPWVRTVAALVLVLVPTGIAVARARREFVRMQQDTGLDASAATDSLSPVLREEGRGEGLRVEGGAVPVRSCAPSASLLRYAAA